MSSEYSAVPHRQNQQLRKILMQNLDTSNDEEWFAFVDILTDSITRQIRSGMVPGQRDSPPLNDVLWVLTDACYRGKLKEVIHLLSGDHVDVNEFFKVPRLDVQWTPLTSAAMGGQTTLVKILINRYGARVDNPNTRGMTALTAAAFAGFPEICQILLDHGANIEAPGLRGETALIGAASGGHGTTVDLLMKRGANIESVDNDGRTALMKAAKFGCTGTVDLLVTRYGADCAARDKDGMTAEMIAVEEGNEDVANLIKTLSTCPKIFDGRKTLDDLYKKVEAALDRQLVAEAKMDELMRHLCEKDKNMLLEVKDRSIKKHIASEDLLVDYQRRLLEAGKDGEQPDSLLFDGAVEIVEKNTRETEEEMMSFVRLVDEVSSMQDRYVQIKEELKENKKLLAEVGSKAGDLIENMEVILGQQHEISKDEVVKMEELMHDLTHSLHGFKELTSLLRVLQDGADGEDALARLRSLAGLEGAEDGESTNDGLNDEDGSNVAGSLAKWLYKCEKDIHETARNTPLAELLPQLEGHLTTLKTLTNRHFTKLPLCLDLAEAMRKEIEKQGGSGGAFLQDVDSGSNPAIPITNRSPDNQPLEDINAIVSKPTCSTIGAMDTSQVLGLLEIKLDGDTYRRRPGPNGGRGPRRSHRNWQVTKRSSSEIAADLNTAEKIADLLQKSKLGQTKHL